MTKKEAFFKLIGLLERENIRYALVGNTDEYPDHVGSDVDIVTDEPGLALFHREIWTLECSGLRVVQCFQHEITAFYYILAFRTDDGGWGFIQPDICTDYYRRARKLLDAVPMLERRRKQECPRCPGSGFFVLAPHDEFLYYLLKKIGKNRLSESQFEHLRRIFASAPDICRAALGRFPAISAPVVAALKSGDAASLSAALPDLKKSLLRSGALGTPRWFRDAIRKLSRILHPTGFVAVLPGASGEKRERAAHLHVELFHAFRRQTDFSASEKHLFRNLAKARTTSTFAILDAMPVGPSRFLVDAVLSPDPGCTSVVLDRLTARAKSRYRAIQG